jgi:uracil-DNA glycosylase
VEDFPARWRALLDHEAAGALARAIATADAAIDAGKPVFPARAQWFAALAHTPPEAVRAVILGQDPYPTRGNAMGLAFSVPRGVAIPASLRNIYKALREDLDILPATHGDLSAWAARGVLLLNTTLTVEEGQPNVHADIGWSAVTDAVINVIGAPDQKPKVFLLWGAHAQKKAPLINAAQHLVLTAPHPSPLSAHRGFFACKHFSQANVFLRARGLAPIDWVLTD